MLAAFLRKPEAVLTKDEIAQLLWPDRRNRDDDRPIHNLISKLRRMHPQAASWFETVPKAGYRFRIPVVEELPERMPAVPPSAAAPLPVEMGPSAPAQSTLAAAPLTGVEAPTGLSGARGPHAQLRLSSVAWLLAALLTAGVMIFGLHESKSTAMSPAAPVTVGVLPLSSNAADRASADTLRGALMDSLAALPNLSLRAEHSFSQPSDLPQDQLWNTARDLKLDLLVGGTLVTSSTDYTANLELVRGRDGAHLQSLHYQGPIATLGSLPTRISEDLAAKLLNRPIDEIPQHLLGGTTSEQAYTFAFQAKSLLLRRTRESVAEAAGLYRRAIDSDRKFAGAWAGLAEADLVSANFGSGPGTAECFENARRAAKQALALDAANAQAHSTLGLVLLQHDWNQTKAEQEMRLAVAEAPGSAVNYLHLALLLADELRFPEALQQVQLAMEVDPSWPVIHGTSMYVHIAARQYPLAIRDAEALTAARPEWSRAHRHLGWALWYSGDHAAGVKEWIKADSLEDRPNAVQSEIAGLSLLNEKGVKAYAEQKIAAQERRDTRDDDYVAAEWFAFAGDREQTLLALDKLVKSHDPESLKLPSNPAYDFLRGDPRFQELVLRIRA